MTIDTQIIDNVLPPNYIKELLDVINYEFIWDWQERTTYEDNDPLPSPIWDKQMSSMVYRDGKVHNQKYGFILPMLYILEEKFNINIKTLIRIKVNKTFTIPEDEYVSAWHCDGYGGDIKTILIYLDESDGGTVLSDVRVTGDYNIHELRSLITPDSEKEYIEYKLNRAVLFDSTRLHYGELPKKHKCRTVMNIVFV